MSTDPEPRYAARCSYLRMTLDSKRMGTVVNLCTHIIRDGSECVGPFLDETETACGLWELKQGNPILGRREYPGH